jgi:hypothetical protein
MWAADTILGSEGSNSRRWLRADIAVHAVMERDNSLLLNDFLGFKSRETIMVVELPSHLRSTYHISATIFLLYLLLE